MGTFFLLLSTWTNPHADDLEFPLKSFNPEQMHWFITAELWDHLSFCKQYVEPDSLFFFQVNSFRALRSPKRNAFYLNVLPFCRAEAKFRNNCFFFYTLRFLSNFKLAGKIEAYVYFPQQLSPMEIEALQGEITVWLHPSFRNSHTKDIYKYSQLCIIRSVIFENIQLLDG